MHKKLIKIYFKIIMLFIFIISPFYTLITFAQTNTNQCNSCGTPPAQFHNYESFVKDILGSIQIIATAGEYTGKPVSPSRFQGKVFEIPKENQFTINKLVSGIKDKFKKTTNIFGATSAILFTIGRELVVKDGVGGFSILFKQRSFVEAQRVLLDLDALIYDKMFELGLAGSFFEKITPINRNYIQQAINKYVQTKYKTGALLETANLQDGVKYYQITEMLLRTNSAMKTFVAGNFIGQFENKEFQKGSNKTKTNFLLKFNYEQIKLMKEQYQCARGIIGLKNCNKAFKKFASNIKKILGDTKIGATKSKDTILDANKKLAQSFAVTTKQIDGKDLTEDDKKFLDQEKKLLMTLYGLDADKMIQDSRFAKINKFRSTNTKGDFSLKSEGEQSNTKQKIEQAKENIEKKNEAIKEKFRIEEKESFEKNRNQAIRECLENYDKDKRKELTKTINIYTKNIQKDIKNTISSCSEIYELVDIIEDGGYNSKNIKYINKNKVEEAIKNGNTDKQINPELIDIYIKSMDTIIDHQENIVKQMVLADNKDLTLFFSEIFKQTHTIKKIIGTKDEGIINNLGAACDLQCSNKGGKCYYQ